MQYLSGSLCLIQVEVLVGSAVGVRCNDVVFDKFLIVDDGYMDVYVALIRRIDFVDGNDQWFSCWERNETIGFLRTKT
jgi:hypothetical protein